MLGNDEEIKDDIECGNANDTGNSKVKYYASFSDLETEEKADIVVKKISELTEERDETNNNKSLNKIAKVMPKEDKLPGSLEKGLKAFGNKCEYEQPSIYDYDHLMRGLGIFLQTQTVFQIYITKRFEGEFVWLYDLLFCIFLHILLAEELGSIARLNESKYVFYKSITKAGVIIDFDNTDLEGKYTNVLRSLQFELAVGVGGIIIAMLFEMFAKQADGLQFSTFTAFILVGSSMWSLKDSTSEMKELENTLLSISKFVEQDGIWARGK